MTNARTHARTYVVGPLLRRLRAKITIGEPAACWLWTGGVSRGGKREVVYGIIRQVKVKSRLWRVNRLVLILKTAPNDVPRDPDEPIEVWLARAARFYDHLDAAHTCDVSLCANWDHLEWQEHTRNVADGATRRRRR